MKKIFTLFFALFTMAFFANAQQQVTVILEAHNVWGDGSGYQLLLDADHTAYGTVIPTSGALTSDASTTINYASTFEYTIPANADGSASSTNVVVDGSVTITIPAGTYDFCVTNPTAGDRIWIAAGDNGRKDDYVFDPAYIYHFTVALDGQNDAVTIDLIPNTTDPTIIATPTSIDFGSVNMPGSSIATTSISAYNLTAGITATTAAPFSVSADDNIYGTTATIAQAGGTLYVKYTPTSTSTENGTVTLTSGTATVTIPLTGIGVDCGNITLPFVESFESADCPASCWNIVYGDNDPSVNTMIHSTTAYTDGLQSFRFSSYSSKTDYTQYLITPAFPAGNRILLFDYAASNSSVETFQVGFSSTGNNIGDFTWSDTLSASNSDGWQTYADAVPANAVYIAIKYFSDYKYYLYIDNFRVMEAGESLFANPDAMDFIGIMGTPTDAQTASFIGTSLTNNITINATAPFEVSVDNGTSFGTTASIPYSATSSLTSGDILVRYNPTTSGNHTGAVVLTSGNSSDTITVSGNATDCSAGITSLPYLYDFNTGMYPPLCWGYNNAENFIKVEINPEAGDYGIAVGEVDYLSCPEIHSTSPILLSIDYATYGGSQASTPSSFRIGYSTTTDSYNNFTWMQAISVMTDGFTSYSALMPAGTKYVAVDATEIGTFLMYGIFEYPNYLFFDNFSLTEVNNPQIFADATTIDFGTISFNTTVTETVAITSALLTTDITATTTAPFEVSTDNTTFGATATLPAAGGNLYVRYSPTAVGTHTGNIILTATGATSLQIALNGSAVDCSNTTIPYFTDFSDEGMNQCWTIVDANNDGSTFELNAEDGYALYVYNSVNNADDWLISPVFNLGPTAAASFDYLVASADYPERFAVYVIAAGQTYENATQVVAPTDATNDSEWLTQSINLSAFANQSVQIAIKCISDADEYMFGVTNFTVTDEVAVKDYDNSINIYPNPAHSYINVNATSNISNVEVYTITGQKVGDFTANSTNTTISTANLTTGMYLMRIHTDNGVINKKFSVAR